MEITDIKFFALLFPFLMLSCKGEKEFRRQESPKSIDSIENIGGKYVALPIDNKNPENEKADAKSWKCTGDFKNCEFQKVIPVEDDSLLICSWFFDDGNDEINEFEIFTSSFDTVFKGYPQAEYSIVNWQPLTIQIKATVPNENNSWSLTPVLNVKIVKSNGSFKKEFEILTDNILTFNEIEVLSNNDEYSVFRLFECALNNDSSCISAFKDYGKSENLDGEIGEFYSMLNSILNSLR